MPFAGELACLGAATLWAATVLLFRGPIRDHGPRTINLAVLKAGRVVLFEPAGSCSRTSAFARRTLDACER